MRFEPASACLWVDIERDRLRGTIQEIERGTSMLGINIFEAYSRKWIPFLKEIDSIDRHMICRIRHELDHLRRHLGTSFGLFYHFVNSSFPYLFFQACEVRAKGDQLRFPLFDPSLRSNCKVFGYRSFASTSEDAAAFVYWQSGKELLRVLDGDPAMLDSEIGLARLQEILSTLSGSPQSVKGADPNGDEKALLPFVSRRNAALPQWQGVEFGGRHLLEALAFGAEASLALLSGIEPKLVAQGMDLDHYGLIAEIWAGLVNEPDSVLPQDRDRDLPSRSLAYLAAVDLALWIPITPTGLAEAGRALSWDDIQPGWRFLKICGAVQEHRLAREPFPISVEDTNAPYRELQNRICDALGWPTVDHIAAEWLKFLVPQLEEERSSGFFWETGKHHPRLVSSVALLSRRLAWPYQIAFNYYNFSQVKLMFFPILLARDGQMIYARDQAMWAHFEAPEFRRAMPFLIHHGVRKLAEGKEHALHLGSRYDEALVNFFSAHGEPFGVDANLMRRAAEDFLAAQKTR